MSAKTQLMKVVGSTMLVYEVECIRRTLEGSGFVQMELDVP